MPCVFWNGLHFLIPVGLLQMHAKLTLESPVPLHIRLPGALPGATLEATMQQRQAHAALHVTEAVRS